MKRVASLVMAFGLGTAAWAQTAEIPAGCTPRATVHKQSCVATTIFDCGTRLDVVSYENGKKAGVHFYDMTWGFAGFLFQANPETRFDRKAGDGEVVNLSTLLAEGTDHEKTTVLFSSRVVKGRQYLIEATLTMSGESIELDGHTLQHGTFDRTFERKGIESTRLSYAFDFYVSEDLDLFIEGSQVRRAEGVDDVHIDHTPLGLRLEGQPGFLATVSEFGCDG
jgi:hypothetical protein